METGKKWYVSKTVWVNAIALFAMVAQMQSGFIVTPDLQAVLLTLVNLGLRAVTKEEITW